MAVAPIVTSQPVTAGTFQLAAANANPGAIGVATMPAANLATNFQEFLAGAVQQTNQLQKDSAAMQEKLVTGQEVELHDVMISMEKASLSFQLTTQVRNKMVEAYQEIMRMQI